MGLHRPAPHCPQEGRPPHPGPAGCRPEVAAQQHCLRGGEPEPAHLEGPADLRGGELPRGTQVHGTEPHSQLVSWGVFALLPPQPPVLAPLHLVAEPLKEGLHLALSAARLARRSLRRCLLLQVSCVPLAHLLVCLLRSRPRLWARLRGRHGLLCARSYRHLLQHLEGRVCAVPVHPVEVGHMQPVVLARVAARVPPRDHRLRVLQGAIDAQGAKQGAHPTQELPRLEVLRAEPGGARYVEAQLHIRCEGEGEARGVLAVPLGGRGHEVRVLEVPHPGPVGLKHVHRVLGDLHRSKRIVLDRAQGPLLQGVEHAGKGVD
mmetsp:Transcript_47583/g.152470  ORF Transcript_47583/g.152470 Transcript_47583/m.152470 type:complete len:319 (-) Transcript_47583:182-1138(-)